MTDEPQEPRADQTEPEQPVQAEPVVEPVAEELPKPGKDACTMAMLAHLLAIFTGFIGPLIMYLIKKDEDRFIAFHSLQALYWELAILVGLVVFGFLSVFLCCFAVPGMGIGVVGIVFNILTLIKANNGEWAEYPVVGQWAPK